MKKITRSFTVVLSFALIFSSLPPSALAVGATALVKTGVVQPVVFTPIVLNSGGVTNMATMPGGIVTLKNIPGISVLPVFQAEQTADKAVIVIQDSAKAVKAEVGAPGAIVKTSVIPTGTKTVTIIKSKSLVERLKAAVLKSDSKDVNWDNSAKGSELNEPPVAVNKEGNITNKFIGSGASVNGMAKSPKTGPNASVQAASAAPVTVQSKGTNGQSGIGTIEFLWTLGIICGSLVAAGWALTYPLIVIGSTVAGSTIGGLIGHLKGYLDYKKEQKTSPFAMRSFDPTASGIAIGFFVGLIGSIWYLRFFPIWANSHSLAQVAKAFFWPF